MVWTLLDGYESGFPYIYKQSAKGVRVTSAARLASLVPGVQVMSDPAFASVSRATHDRGLPVCSRWGVPLLGDEVLAPSPPGDEAAAEQEGRMPHAAHARLR